MDMFSSRELEERVDRLREEYLSFFDRR